MKNKIIILFALCISSLTGYGQSIISTFAGTGTAGYTGDGGQAIAANLSSNLQDIAVDGSGNVFITVGNYIRRIAPSGIITRYAGGGGSTAEGIPATNAVISNAYGIAIDGAGNLYYAEFNSHKVRKVSTSGIVTTVAGDGSGAFGGDGGLATNAQLSDPTDVAVNTAGTIIYIADYGNFRVRKVDMSTGIITTFAGGGGSTTYGIPATNFNLGGGTGSCDAVSVDGSGNLYITCMGASSVRKVVPSSGLITSIGTFSTPTGATPDASGNIYVTEFSYNRIKKVAVSSGTISNYISGGGGYAGDGCVPSSAGLYHPWNVAFNSAGNMYITDNGSYRVRKIDVNHDPTFVNGPTQSIVACLNPTTTLNATPINTELSITEIDFGSRDLWTVSSAPSHGSIVGIAAAGTRFTSTGTNTSGAYSTTTLPTGISYVPAPGYTGSSDAFTITVTDCYGASTSTTINVSYYALMTAFTVTGTAYYCAGTSPLSVGIPNSETGVNYSLYKNGTLVAGSSLAGSTGSPLSWGGITITSGTATYTIKATNTTTGCMQWMTGSAIITYSALPNNQTMTPAATACHYCSGGSGIVFGLSATQSGVSYQLYSSTSGAVGSPVSGAGSSITFSPAQTVATTYYVIATNAAGCTRTLSPTRAITIDPLPNSSYTVSGGGHYCAGGTGVTITLSNSETGVRYQLYNGTSTVGSLVNGVTGSPRTWTGITGAGTYTIKATTTLGCGPVTMTGSVTVTVDPLPTAYVVTGGGSYCSGGTGVAVGLSNSDGGITYTLKRGATIVTTVSGTTGTAINFGTFTTAGTYTVVATDATTGCSRAMTGTAVISIIALPNAYGVTGGGRYCAGGTGVAVGLGGSQSGVTYSLYNGAAFVTTVTGAGTSFTFGPQTTAGTYTVLATNAAGCTRAMTGSATVSVNPLPIAYTVSVTGTVCAPSPSFSVVLNGSQIGYRYQVYNGSTPLSPIWTNTSSGTVGTSTTTTHSWGPYTTGGPYTIMAMAPTSPTPVCSLAMIGSISIIPVPVAGTLSGTTTICVGSNSTITSSGFTGGVWASGNTSVATVGTSTGIVNGVATGTALISYTVTNSCGTATVTTVVTIVDVPSVATIGSFGTVCMGTSITLTDATSGGVWGSSDGSVATVAPSTGAVTPVNPGTCTISYSVTNSCGTTVVTAPMTVDAIPTVAAITGGTLACMGSALTLSDATSAGVWSSTMTSIATIDPGTGILTPVNTGSTIISYTVTNDCGTTAATSTITVDEIPVVSPISGVSIICMDATPPTFTDATLGGTWSSSDGSVATVDAAGVVTPVSVGSCTISYSVTSACGTTVVTLAVTVDDVPVVPAITGATLACIGSTITLSDATSGGVWISTASSIAAIDAGSGVVTPGTIGSTTISYTVTNTCGSTTVTEVINVDDLPVVSAISGPTSGCLGSILNLTDATTGGVWSSGTTSVATVSSIGDVTLLTAGTSAISYAVTNGCGTTTVTMPVTAIAQAWTGASDVDWNNTGNWACGRVPTITDDVTIPAGTPHDPTIYATDAGYTRALNILSGVTITINGSAILTVNGDLTNNAIVTGSGEIKLNNTTTQTIYGIGFVNNLELDNGAGATINGTSGNNVQVKKTLTLTNGLLTTNNNLTLWSDAAGTGRIATITGGSITGNVTCMQYVFGGHRAYRFWGHPYSTDIHLDQIQGDIDITGLGGATNGFTTTATNNPSCFWYNTAAGNSTLASDPGWTAFTSTTGGGSNNFYRYEGIRLFIRGAFGEGLGFGTYTPSPTTITTSGPVNTGTLTVPLVRTNVMVGSAYSQTYNMVSNPYPSPIDIGTLLNSHGNAAMQYGPYYWIWNPYLSTAGQFVRKDIGTSYYIQANCSYQVRAEYIATGAYLTFYETDKVATYADQILRPVSSPSNNLSLNVYNESYQLYDMMDIAFNDKATDGEDRYYDAGKPMSPDFNFYGISTDKQLHSLEARPYKDGTVIPLGISSNCNQPFIIKVDNYVAPQEGKVYLYDKFLDKYILLAQGTEYKFDITEEAGSQGENRFELRLGSIGSSVSKATSKLMVTLSPNPTNDEVNITFCAPSIELTQIRVLDITGATIITKDLGIQQNGSVKLSLNNLSAGMYLVEFYSGKEKTIQRLIKE